MLVVDFVEGCLELAGLRVHGELIHHRVVHHEWQTVDEAFLGDCLGLFDARRGNARLLVGLVGRGNGVAFFLATDEGSNHCARERQLDDALFSWCHGWNLCIGSRMNSVYFTTLTAGIFHVPLTIEGFFSFGQ